MTVEIIPPSLAYRGHSPRLGHEDVQCRFEVIRRSVDGRNDFERPWLEGVQQSPVDAPRNIDLLGRASPDIDLYVLGIPAPELAAQPGVLRE